MLSLEDRKKIGIGLLSISFLFFTLGVLLIFDRSLILMANMCFLAGLYALVGFSRSLNFFIKKGKLKGGVLYFLGFLIIVFRHPFIGFCLQIYGILVLFKSFIPFLYEWSYNIPFVGPHIRDNTIIKKVMELVGTRRKPDV
eukprot:TRINITY_DN389_c0_g1_i4.p1 TRINITY_DN389_c0_g1~~TRINITY_DN389_c0_g1_i4.p1  ORF type:complete len:141 (+),score=29.87 TRINITY_DN389_c0_g1_i4:139-561(+)